jgi:hypothetical protein
MKPLIQYCLFLNVISCNALSGKLNETAMYRYNITSAYENIPSRGSDNHFRGSARGQAIYTSNSQQGSPPSTPRQFMCDM